MTTYYVRKTGDDGTGDGSTGAPWLTIQKGITSIAAGDTLLIGAGTYAENSGSGYFFITAAFASTVTIGSESGNADDVIITGASGTTYNTLIQANGGKLSFQNLTFKMRTNEQTSGALRIIRGSDITFTSCKFVVLTSAADVRIGVIIADTSTYVVNNITLTGCTISCTGTDAAYGMTVTTGGSGTTSNIYITDCTITSTSYCLYAYGGTNVVTSGGTFTTPALPALVYGKDTTSTTSVTGTISGVTATSTTSHAVLVGYGAGGVVVQNSTINGGDLGLVLKQNSGCKALNNTINNGTNGSLYFKAATNATATGNTITNAVGGPCIRLGAGDTGDKSGADTVTNNTVIASGTAYIMGWGDATEDSGGCVCDYNAYNIEASSVKFGVLRADNDVQSIAELRLAWAGYDVSGNDVNSRATQEGADTKNLNGAAFSALF